MNRDTIEIANLIVISRDAAVLRPLWAMGESNGWQLEIAANAWEAIDKIQSGANPDLILLDTADRDGEGLHILRWLRRLRPSMPVILIGRQGETNQRQESIRLGASDYVCKPFDDIQLESAVQRYLFTASEDTEAEITSDDVEPIGGDTFFIGISPTMRKLRAQAALLAKANVPVLILGEDGSGKETTARLVHRLSVRSEFEFANVNCAVLPGDLLERELFGYERVGPGALVRTMHGKLELCAKGTILLDEITEIPSQQQQNLLRVMQDNRFIRPGSSEMIEVDVRVMASGPADVHRAVSQQRLREDLYQHLSAYTIYVPPLRERKEELPLLSRHFMHKLAKHYDLPSRDLSPEIIEEWQAYDWPGNLRELECLVKRYLMVGDKDLMFEKARLEPQNGSRSSGLVAPGDGNHILPSSTQTQTGVSDANSLRSLVNDVKSKAEKNAIAAALEKTGWNRKAAARLLNVSYRTILYKIEQFHMHAPSSPGYPRPNRQGTEGPEPAMR